MFRFRVRLSDSFQLPAALDRALHLCASALFRTMSPSLWMYDFRVGLRFWLRVQDFGLSSWVWADPEHPHLQARPASAAAAAMRAAPPGMCAAPVRAATAGREGGIVTRRRWWSSPVPEALNRKPHVQLLKASLLPRENVACCLTEHLP